MHGLWMWTITLFSFALFLRGEKPLRLKIRHLKLPSNYSGTILFFWFHLFYHLPKYLSKQLTSWIEYYCWSQKYWSLFIFGGPSESLTWCKDKYKWPLQITPLPLIFLVIKGFQQNSYMKVWSNASGTAFNDYSKCKTFGLTTYGKA